MVTRFQYAAIAIVYGLTIIVCATMLYPCITEESAKMVDLTQHKQQKEQLDIKLKDRERVIREKQTLVSDIAALRNAVPKSPNLDVLLIDLEKLASEANVDLIAIENPGTQDLKESQKEMSEMLEDLKGKTPKAKPKAEKTPPANSSKTADVGAELGLKQIDKEVYVTGTYASMVQFIRNIEAYERVMGVSHVVIAVPNKEPHGESDKSTDRAKQLKLDQPVMSFLLSVYYLP